MSGQPPRAGRGGGKGLNTRMAGPKHGGEVGEGKEESIVSIGEDSDSNGDDVD